MTYISREAFDKEIMRRYCENCERRKGKKNGKIQFVYEFGDAPCRACDIADVMCALEDFPAADVREVARGKWIDVRYDDDELVGGWYTIPKCSVCEEEAPYKSNFCPNCGAEMREDNR